MLRAISLALRGPPLQLRKYQIEIAPVFGGTRAFTDPVGIVVQVVGNLRRPVTAKPAIVDVPLDGLAESACTAGCINFPARRKYKAATYRHVLT